MDFKAQQQLNENLPNSQIILWLFSMVEKVMGPLIHKWHIAMT